MQQLLAVLDSSNVAWGATSFSDQNNPRLKGRRPPLRGLVLAVNYCIRASITPKAIIPAWWTKSLGDADGLVLKELIDAGICFLAPPGTHDDLFILQYASQQEGRRRAVAIISNDQFKDHQLSDLKLDPAWIASRRIPFMFIDDEFVPDMSSLRFALARLSSLISPGNDDAMADVEMAADLHAFAVPVETPYADLDTVSDMELDYSPVGQRQSGLLEHQQAFARPQLFLDQPSLYYTASPLESSGPTLANRAGPVAAAATRIHPPLPPVPTFPGLKIAPLDQTLAERRGL